MSALEFVLRRWVMFLRWVDRHPMAFLSLAFTPVPIALLVRWCQ